MPECCNPDDYQSVFSGRFARRQTKRYQRRGLTPAARGIADFVASRGIERATVLEIGTRRFLDIAQAPDEVEPADVVVLHRVVCCYPDYAALLRAAAGHARKTLAYSHPAVNAINRAQFSTENLYRWVTRNDFRTFIHPPEGMVRAAEAEGMTVAFRRHSRDWDVVGLVR